MTTAAAASYKVIVHFATSNLPRIIGTFGTREAAEREARGYTSDARGVWVELPDGTRKAI